jgi:hypothetical protein
MPPWWAARSSNGVSVMAEITALMLEAWVRQRARALRYVGLRALARCATRSARTTFRTQGTPSKPAVVRRNRAGHSPNPTTRM